MKTFENDINVILTFDSGPQEFYDVAIKVDYEKIDQDFEVSVVAAILSQSERDLSDLVKISLAYTPTTRELPEELKYLIRHSAKYYFQPNQRDDYEQAIVDELGIASKTKNFEGKPA